MHIHMWSAKLSECTELTNACAQWPGHGGSTEDVTAFLSVNAARLPDVQGVQPVESLRSVTLGYYGQEAVVEKPAL